jgi:hypothetical protein
MELKLTIEGGNTRRVQLRTVVPEGLVAFRHASLDAGPIPVGLPTTLNVELLNKGRADTSFRVLESPGLICKPSHGGISTGDSKVLQLQFNANSEDPFSSTVVVELRGGKVIKLPVRATPIMPEVSVLEDQFDFGQVYHGGSLKLPFTLLNTSPVEARVVVDLREHSAFSLSIGKEEWDPSRYIHCPLTCDHSLAAATSQGTDLLQCDFSCLVYGS